MMRQSSFTETMYVYECPRCGARHWDADNLEDEEGCLALFCSVCESTDGEAFQMKIVDQFQFNPFDFRPPDRLPV